MVINVYDKVCNETSKLAISEIKYYFNKIFNAEINQVSEQKDSNLSLEIIENEENDKISIKLHEGKCEIISNNNISLLIAVYRLFGEFGAVYTRPGKKFEYLPSLDIDKWFSKEIEIEENAVFKHRGVCIEGADSFENVVDFIEWLPKINMNSFFIQFENPYSFLKRWYEHEFNPYVQKEEFSIEKAQSMSDLIDLEINKRGIIHHRVGHGWTGEVLGYSSKYGWEQGLVLPEEKKYLAAELNGKRELFNTAPILTSLCFSNIEVSEKMTDIIVDYAKQRKDVDYLHVWLSDARNNICECEGCQKDIPADQYIRILNMLDEKLTKENLETKICFLLYHELLFSPKYEKLNNPNRFTMMFAPITRTFEKSYADVNYEKDIPACKEYVRNKMVLPNSLEENLSYLFSWKEDFKCDSFVYDYPLGRAHYGDLGYMKISKVIFRDIKYLNNLKLNGYISCQELRAGFPHNFPNYVMGNMLWNNKQDYESLKAKYFEAMYGENYEKVIKYLEKLSQYSSCDYFNSIGDRQDADLSNRYMVSHLLSKNFMDIIEENIVSSVGTQKYEWRQLSYHRTYVVKMAYALYCMTSGNYQKAQILYRDILDYIRNTESLFQPHFDVYRVIEVSKNYTGFKL